MASITKHKNGWRAFIRRAGLPSASRVLPTRREAERWARDTERELEHATTTPVDLRLTLGDVLGHYIEHVLPRSAGPSRRRALRALSRNIGHLRLRELSVQALTDYARRRQRAGAGPVTIGMDLSYLGTALTHAGAALLPPDAVSGYLTTLKAAKAVLGHARVTGASFKRERRPTDAELCALRDHFAQARLQLPMWTLIQFAVATTLRLGEIVALRWSDLDEERRLILVRDRKHPQQKRGNNSLIPLLSHSIINGETIDPLTLIQSQASIARRENRIFPYRSQSVSQAFCRAVAACGIQDLRFHDLRHDGVSRMFEYGYTIEQVALLSGHASWENLKRYTQINPEILLNYKPLPK
jgi:integrase